jgi:hypothetical protein
VGGWFVAAAGQLTTLMRALPSSTSHSPSGSAVCAAAEAIAASRIVPDKTNVRMIANTLFA